MNVVTANQNKEIIDKLDIDILKRIDGQYELKELLSKFVNLYFNKMIIDITSIADYQNIEVIKQLATAVDPNRVIILLNNEEVVSSNFYISNLISCGFYNFTRNLEGIKFLYNTPNTLENVKHLVMSDEEVERKAKQAEAQQQYSQEENIVNKKRIIVGLVNLTAHAGASTLTHMLVSQLNNNGKEAYGIEMFRQDLIFYRDDRLTQCFNKNDLDRALNQFADARAIFMDLNDFGEANRYCDYVLYLVEPSNIMLTKLLKKDKNAFTSRTDEKIVLNKSFINDQDIPDFEYETKAKVFFNMPPLNDRNENIDQVNQLLNKLGL